MTAERDEARAIRKGSAINDIICVHHTDAERAALPVGGNCPVCASVELAAAKAHITDIKRSLTALKDALREQIRERNLSGNSRC